MSTKFSVFGVAIVVSDLDASVRWYSDVLGFELVSKTRFEPIKADIAFMKCGDVQIELMHGPEGIKLPELFAAPPEHIRPIGSKSLILSTPNLAEVTEALVKKGVIVLWQNLALDDSGKRNTAIRDADGNFISIFGA